MSIFITMNHREFSPYHNKHIRFTYSPPGEQQEELTGVVVDVIRYDRKTSPTDYIYIRSLDLREWQQADENGDSSALARLQRIINIEFITHAELINR